MNLSFKAVAFFSAITIIHACSDSEQEAIETSGLAGVDQSYFDKSVEPCTDFYQYANGTWLKNNPIPGSESRWGSFHEVRDNNNKILKRILEEAAANTGASPGSDQQKIGDFYFTAMDSTQREATGISSIQPLLDRINSITNIEELIKELAHQHSYTINSMFRISVGQDMKKSDQYAVHIVQGGTGLPIPELYYDSQKAGPLKELYFRHLQAMFELLGEDKDFSEKAANTIIEIETSLARSSMTAVERRDLDAQYNKMTIEQLAELAPAINWEMYFPAVGIDHFEYVIVGQPEFFKTLSGLISRVSIDDWKIYLKWHLLHETASKLTHAMLLEHHKFYSTAMRGIKELRPRWRLALDQANGLLGELLGKQFIKKAFSQESKDRLNGIIDNLLAVFRERVQKLEWMSDETKKEAFAKLDKVYRKIGFPDEWRDFSAMDIKRDSYVMNYMRANRYWMNDRIARLGTPVDRTEWLIPPQTVNAFYHPSNNSICFPAGILQPPFMDPEADDAILYGTIGAVIGHELTHGFDDMGKQFDSNGNKRNWWTEEDSVKFSAKAQKITDQYNGFKMLDTLNVNGELTLGENIADLGGLTIAYYAFLKSLDGGKEYMVDSLTCFQQFFLGFAQVWKGQATDAEVKRLLMLDPHSPPIYRVKGVLSNMPEFYEVFGCGKNDPLYRPAAERAKIW